MDLMAARRSLLMQNPLKTYEVTGNPAVFSTNVAKKLKSLIVPFTPVQEGTGDPSPQNVRNIVGWNGLTVTHNGANLLDLSSFVSDERNGVTATKNADGSISLSGTASANVNLVLKDYDYLYNYGFIKPDTTYILTGAYSDTVQLAFGVYGTGTDYKDQGTGKAFSFSASDIASKRYRVVVIVNSGVNTNGIKLYPMIKCGNTVMPYEPYSGSSYPVTFPAMGKNLYGGNLNEYLPLSLSAGTTICVSGVVIGSYGALRTYDSNKNFLESVSIIQGSGRTYNVKTLSSACSYVKAEVSGTSFTDIQVELGSSPTTFEPFTNTVYGGSLDLTTGVLTVEWKGMVFDGSEDENWNVEQGENFYIMTPTQFVRGTTQDNMICNLAKSSSNVNTSGACRITSSGNFNIRIGSIIEISTVDAFKTWLSTNNIQISCQLATPITYQLSNILQITSLLGSNTVWSDTNGSNTIQYVKKG